MSNNIAVLNRNASCLSLDGSWGFIRDETSALSFPAVQALEGKNELSGQMTIPINWQRAGLENYNGTVWFIKRFSPEHNSPSDGMCILQFDGVDYFAEVWLNGCFLGRHEGYFQQFRFTVTEFLKFNEENTLVVRVTSPMEEPGKVWPLKKQLIKGIFNHHDCRPGGWNMQRGQDQNTGGIWNSVNLYYGTDIFPETVKVTPRLIENGRARILIDVSCISRIPNPENRLITFTVTSPSGSVTEIRENFLIEPGCTRMNTAFDLDEPELWYSWDTGKQNLYIINSEIFLHAVEFGIREVMLDSSSNFYLNGKKLFLRGTNIIPELQLSSLNRYRIGDMAERIKRANINIVRVHAHINRRELYEEFTRAGILIWQDFSLQWTYDDSTAFVPNAVSQIKDMVRQLYNYPSIAFWCCHNEPGEQIRTLDPFLRDAVLSEDNSRIVRLASNYEEHAYDGWYWGSMEHFAAAPMGPLVTEFGAQAIPEMESLEDFQTAGPLSDINWKEWEYHNFQFEQTFNIADVKTGETLDDFIYNSQMYQAGLITKAVHFYRRRKNNGITGIFQFMLIDPWPAITWSVVDYYRREKAGYYALQKAYEPLLVSVNLWQKRYIPEGKLMLDIKIINDRWQDFNRCCLIVKMDNNVLWESVEMNIPENQVVSLGPNDTGIFVPPQIPAGIKELEFVLTECHSGKILARSDLSVEIAKRNDVF